MRHAVLSLLFLAACAANETPEVPEVISNTPASIAEARFADTLGIDLTTFQQNADGLHWKDLEVGDGAEVVAGTTVDAYYAGYLPDGTNFENSRIGSPITFAVGTGRVIAGWDQGLLGMRVGGKRQLIIPPALGYGATGSGGVIPPNATLIFTVEVIGAR